MTAAEAHLVDRLKAVPHESQPFPHFYASGVFPADVYADMVRFFPGEGEFSHGGAYWSGLDLTDGRVGHMSAPKAAFWRDVSGWLLGDSFLKSMVALTYPYLKERFADRNPTLVPFASFARSTAGHALGPHTDMKHRVFTLVFYFPETDGAPLSGTSIYTPRESGFTCPGGRHYGFEAFRKIATIRFQPNTVFGFVKTANSFHGVEPWSDPAFVRNTLQYEINDADKAYYSAR